MMSLSFFLSPSRRCISLLIRVVVIFIVLFSGFHVNSLIENFKTESIVNDIDYTSTLISLPSDLAVISPTQICMLENGDFLFVDSYVLKRYYYQNNSVAIYLGRGSRTDDDPIYGIQANQVDTKKSNTYWVKGLSNSMSGNCAFTDSKRVRLIDSNTDRVKTIAGSISSTNASDYQIATNVAFSSLAGTALDENDNLYLMEYYTIRRVLNSTKVITTIAGSSTGSYPNTLYPDGSKPLSMMQMFSTIVASKGVVYFGSGNAILKIVNDKLYTVAGNWTTCTFNSSYKGSAIGACLSSPKPMRLIDDELYFTDSADRVIRKIDKNGNIVLLAGGGTEVFYSTRLDQNIKNVSLPAFKGVSFFKREQFVEVIISLTSSIIKVKEDGTFSPIVRKQINYFTDSYYYGLQFSPSHKVSQFSNGDVVLVGDDKQTLYRLSKRTKRLKQIFKFDFPISTIVVDRDDYSHVFIVSKSTSCFYFYEYNLKSKSMSLIAGNPNGTVLSTPYSDHQNSLETLIQDVDTPVVLNSTIYYRDTQIFKVIAINPLTKTIKIYFGSGKDQSWSVSGIGNDIMSSELFLDIFLTTDPNGRVIIDNRFLIMYLEEKNNTLQVIVGEDVNINENPYLPIKQEDVLIHGGVMASYHPNQNTLHFVVSNALSNGLVLVELFEGVVREVLSTSISYFVIRKSTNVIYYSFNKDMYSYDPVSKKITLLFTHTDLITDMCLKSDSTIYTLDFYGVNQYQIGVSTKLASVHPSSLGRVECIYCASNGDVYASIVRSGSLNKLAKLSNGVFEDLKTNLTGKINSMTFDSRGNLIVHMNNMLYSIKNFTTLEVIGGARKNTPFKDQAISGAATFWTISKDGDIYYHDTHSWVFRKASRSTGFVNDVIGNGTDSSPTKFTARCALISETTKDGNFLTKCNPKGVTTSNTIIYSPSLDKFFVSNFSVPVSLDITSFTKDGEILFPTTANGLQRLSIECERDRFGFCLKSYPYCFGIHYNNESSCNGRGDCIDSDFCECYDGYISPDCSVTYCFGVLSNNSNVCSGNGQCVDEDVCDCQSGYYGNTCSYLNDTGYSCFGENVDTPTTCNGNGKCIGKDTCKCFSNFTGPACSERVCKVGYFGIECEIVECFGILSNDSRVCSSNGTCSSFNNCTCFEGKNGNICNETTFESSLFNQTMKNVSVPLNETEVMYGNTSFNINNTSFKNESNSISNSTNSTSILQNSTIPHQNETALHVNTTNSTHFNSSKIEDNTNNTSKANHTEIVPSNGTVIVNNTVTILANNTLANNTVVSNQSISQQNITTSNETLIKNSTQIPSNSSSALEIFCFGISQNNASVCNRAGICTGNNLCRCNSGFYGSSCFTQIQSPPNLNNYGNTIEFHLITSTPREDSVLDCKSIISSADLGLFGTNPTCFWKNSSFFIELGAPNSISQNMKIDINMNAFDNSLHSDPFGFGSE